MIVIVENGDTTIVEVGQVGPAGPPANQFRGALARTTSGTINFAGVTLGNYIDSGLTGTLDTTSDVGTAATTVGFGIERTDPGAQWAHVIGTADVGASSNKLLGIRLALNGTTIPGSECRVNVTNQTLGKLHTMWIIQMTQGDEVTLHFANYSSQNSITMERARMTVVGIP